MNTLPEKFMVQHFMQFLDFEDAGCVASVSKKLKSVAMATHGWSTRCLRLCEERDRLLDRLKCVEAENSSLRRHMGTPVRCICCTCRELFCACPCTRAPDRCVRQRLH